MLFNSYVFIILFLPVTVAVFFAIGGRGHHRIAISWLVAASLFFYGWWNPSYVGLILASILFNYAVGIFLSTNNKSSNIYSGRKLILVFGVIANLSLLCYFKYANFFIENFNILAQTGWGAQQIILPLAISFFTFQQVAYLVDAYRHETREYSFLHYCLFVTFFPQLIAGPIVHHKEMLPQFAKNKIYKFNCENIAVGLTIFIIGLFKKVIIADSIAAYATPVFSAADAGNAVTILDAWCGVMAYTFQLYFDFSGYSDMAIGLARMFGIRLPLNFNSPYKSVNIIDFWRRWHMTLSRFLRDYLYLPLGGNRKGAARRYVNLMFVMLLGGLWHGAGWTFVIWGGLHGAFLVINHAWHYMRRSMGHDLKNISFIGRTFSIALTFLVVSISWVFFRAETFEGSAGLLYSMSGINGISLESTILRTTFHDYFLFVILGFAVFFLPNTQQIMSRYTPALETYPGEIGSCKPASLAWSPNVLWSILIALMFLLAINGMREVSEFLYFQF